MRGGLRSLIFLSLLVSVVGSRASVRTDLDSMEFAQLVGQGPSNLEHKPQVIVTVGSAGTGKTWNARRALLFLKSIERDRLEVVWISGRNVNSTELTGEQGSIIKDVPYSKRKSQEFIEGIESGRTTSVIKYYELLGSSQALFNDTRAYRAMAQLRESTSGQPIRKTMIVEASTSVDPREPNHIKKVLWALKMARFPVSHFVVYGSPGLACELSFY